MKNNCSLPSLTPDVSVLFLDGATPTVKSKYVNIDFNSVQIGFICCAIQFDSTKSCYIPIQVILMYIWLCN